MARLDDSSEADVRVQRQLVLTKQLFLQGLALARRSHSSMARLLGVVILDLAAETGMKTAIGFLEPSTRLAKNFDGVLSQLEEALDVSSGGVLDDRGNILHVHEIRNDAQHRARTPTETESADCSVYVRDFLDKLMQRIWDRALASVSLAELVKDSDVRRFLNIAETELSTGRLREAAQASSAAVEMALVKVRRAVVGRKESFTAAFIMEEDLKRPSAFPKGRDVYRSFERMQDVLLLTALGLNLGDYVRFHSLAGEAHFMANGSVRFGSGTDDIADVDADFCVGYATESVLEIESRAGDLEAPFGSASWY
jgi:hypothetical protein